MNNTIKILRLNSDDCERSVGPLAALLADCVAGGASVSFMAPFDRRQAEDFFREVFRMVEAGERILLAAFLGSEIAGTVQIVTALPANQPHRADIAKLLVSPGARRLGVGRSLMLAVEQVAREVGKTLLVLDTVTGAAGEKLYEGLEWVRVGVIPNYALLPTGGFCDTTVFYKALP